MKVEQVVENISTELNSLIDKDYKSGQYTFHSKEFTLLGVRTNHVRKIISEVYQEIKKWDEKDIYQLIELLLKKKFNEYIIIGFGLALKSTKTFTEDQFKLYESWIQKYVLDWAQCDDLCGGVLGKCIYNKPEFVPTLFLWSESENIWFRRASAVSLIYSLKKGKYLDESFELADKLLLDEQDLVQKGYGWMLKVAAGIYQDKVFHYVMNKKENMPRTALRYAIEKMPPDLKKRAMEK